MKIHTLITFAAVVLGGLVGASVSGHPSSGIVVDQQGNVFFSDLSRGLMKVDCVIKITTKVSTVLKSESPWSPSGVAVHGQDIYLLEHINANSEAHEDWPPRVRKVGRDGQVSTLVTFAPEPR